MQDLTSIQDVAVAVGITIDRVRHWAVALGFEVEKVGRVRHVPSVAIEPLREMSNLVSGGISPQAAATMIKARPQAAQMVATTSPASDVSIRFEQIEAAMLALANENRSLRGEVMALRAKIAANDPAKEFERFYSSFFQPVPKVLETCRDRYYHTPLMLTASENIVSVFIEGK